jgi:8-oxo-dGTP pyrophosphatase MutT (NUDIX family)
VRHFAERIRESLALDHPYPERLNLTTTAAHAAVLLVFAPDRSLKDGVGFSLLLTRRAESVESHKGQMAFPGGRSEPDEMDRADFLSTALRETEEEVGIPPGDVEVLGNLPSIRIPTGFQVEPFIALHRRDVSEIDLRVCTAEIAETLWIPWVVLAAPEVYRREMVTRGAIKFPTHVFYHQGHRIWGATGAMIKNLLERWQQVET